MTKQEIGNAINWLYPAIVTLKNLWKRWMKNGWTKYIPHVHFDIETIAKLTFALLKSLLQIINIATDITATYIAE